VYGAEQKVLYTHRNFVFDVGVGGWVWVGVGGCVGGWVCRYVGGCALELLTTIAREVPYMHGMLTSSTSYVVRLT